MKDNILSSTHINPSLVLFENLKCYECKDIGSLFLLVSSKSYKHYCRSRK